MFKYSWYFTVKGKSFFGIFNFFLQKISLICKFEKKLNHFKENKKIWEKNQNCVCMAPHTVKSTCFTHKSWLTINDLHGKKNNSYVYKNNVKHHLGCPKLILCLTSLQKTKPRREGNEIKTNKFFRPKIFICLHH